MSPNTNTLARYVLFIATTQIVLLAPPTTASNILFFQGFGSHSHRLAQEPLANALAAKGHNVTFLVQEMPKPNKNNHPTIQYYVPQGIAGWFENMRKGSDGGGGVNYYNLRASGKSKVMLFFVQSYGISVCESMYKDETFLQWLHNTPKFDLVILDALFNECGYGVAYAHGAKTAVFSVSTVLPWGIDAFGLPDESAWIPDLMLKVPIDMSFGQRVLGAVMPVVWSIYRSWFYLPALERITREGLKVDEFPSYAELERNTSLVLVNTHASQEFSRSLPPNVIPVGGISWVEKRKPLPQNMIDFINEGKEGFIYVSFGSFMDFLTFPEEAQQTFINALKKFPNIQFIWKLNKTPENLPKHIMVDKWLPQQDLLLHPKIRAFITHSGIGGVNEAIYSSVPLICFPLISEQDYNAQLAEKKGFGIKMEITALTEEDMVAAITKMITDKSYKENAKRVTSQFLDRPLNPLETALWWTEHILRLENTDHLRSHNVQLSWWKKRQLDVWLFVLLLTITLNSLGLYISYRVLKRCFKSKASKSKKEKRN